MIDPLLQSKISLWREKAAAGTMTIEEMKEAVILMRGGRFAAAQTASTQAKRKTAKAAIRPASELLGDLLKGGS